MGMKLKPTGFAYFIGAIGNAASGNIAPISAQAETISLAGLVKNQNQRIGALLIAALVGVVIGATGTAQRISDFCGPSIMNGMIAGVGIILALVVVGFAKTDTRTTVVSLVSAAFAYILCLNLGVANLAANALVYTIAFSMAVSIIDFCVIQKRRVVLADLPVEAQETTTAKFWKKEFWSDFKFIKPSFTLGTVFSGLGIICLNIGSNFSFGSITNSIAGTAPDFNAISLINSLADFPSVLFGGAPLEIIISGTAATSAPLACGIVMMIVAGALCFTGALGVLGKYICAESISGFLAIIAFKLTLVSGLMGVMADKDTAAFGFVTFGITVLTKNPFIGLCAGVIARYSGGLFGLLM
jgi:AGZA family xanthine/uracil permease-like MFS transporter